MDALLFRFSDYEFEPETGYLTRLNDAQTQQPVLLRNKVANLLTYFLQHPNELIAKETLLTHLWQHGDYRESALTQSIRELRLALNDDAKSPCYIKTIPQRGYQWICPITRDVNQAESKHSEQPTAKKIQTENTLNKSLGLWIVVGVLMLAGLILAIGIWQLNSGNVANHSEQQNQVTSRLRVMVLPFINDTQQPSMAWLEHGLSDMLAVDLKRSQRVDVISPSEAHLSLLKNELPWPAMPVQIRNLLDKLGANVAIFASVRMHQQKQVIDFQAIYSDGRIKQGSLSYDELASHIEVISQQILAMINVHKHNNKKALPDISAMAIAQGMQALQTTGAAEAIKYFQAANTISQTNWASAYLARSYIAVGKWSEARIEFSKIGQNDLKYDPLLNAFIAYWQAIIATRQGSSDQHALIEKSIHASINSQDPQLIAESYRLQASLAWQAMKWQQHDELLKKAAKLTDNYTELAATADSLFYLGQPNNVGLEKSPYNDLAKNKERLTKALSFYQTLGNLEKIAATQLAIAQNYYFDQEKREIALQDALARFAELNLPYELAMAELYAGFYHMQLHQGQLAEQYFKQAKHGFEKLGAKSALPWADFYIAFSYLDQGLDQSELGRHGQNPEMLKRAINAFQTLLPNTQSDVIKASSYVFVAWAYTDLQQFDKAKHALKLALTHSSDPALTLTNEYARYSLMYIYLLQDQAQKVLEIEKRPWCTRLQAVYVAKAYAALAQYNKAANTLNDLKEVMPGYFTIQDNDLLEAYRRQNRAGSIMLEQTLPKAHSVYCETDWSIDISKHAN